MAELIYVGPELTLTYRIVTEDGFPYGLQCMECKLPIDIGQPYASKFNGMVGDTPVNDLVCVYC